MSKELEALNKIAYSYGYDENIKIIEKALKALEIIKEKGVNAGLLSRCANAERYNKGMCYESRYLTQEEYDLLKEELC